MRISLILAFLSLFNISNFSSCQKSIVNDNPNIQVFELKDFKGNRLDDNGVSIVRKYFHDNRLVGVKYFDKNDKPYFNAKSYRPDIAEWRFEYDSNDNFVRQTAHNAKGELVETINWNNSSIAVLEYNNQNQLIKRRNFDRLMQPIGINEMQIASTTYLYNKAGQLIEELYYDKNGKPVIHGFSNTNFEYNSDSTLSASCCYMHTGQLSVTSKYFYDQGKLQKVETYHDNKEMFYSEKYGYDNNKIVEVETKYKKEVTVEKSEITLDIKGYKIKPSDLASMEFSTFGENKYTIKIDDEGKIENIEPVNKNYSQELWFNNDVYNNFRGIALESDGTSKEKNGTLYVKQIRRSFYSLGDLEQISKPFPVFVNQLFD